MVEGLNEIDPCTTPLVDALNGFFNDLEEEIPTEAILDENDIIKLIREELNETDKNDESEEEPMIVSLGDAVKSLINWITFFEQQQLDEFRTEDIDVFKKYLSLIKQLERKSRKQTSITNFFCAHENDRI